MHHVSSLFCRVEPFLWFEVTCHRPHFLSIQTISFGAELKTPMIAREVVEAAVVVMQALFAQGASHWP